MLRRDILVVHRPRFVLGAVQHLREFGRGAGLLRGALHRRLLRELRLALGAKGIHRLARALDERARELLVEERDAEVLGVDLGVAAAARKLLRGGDRLSRLDRQPVEVHLVLSGRSASLR